MLETPKKYFKKMPVGAFLGIKKSSKELQNNFGKAFPHTKNWVNFGKHYHFPSFIKVFKYLGKEEGKGAFMKTQPRIKPMFRNTLDLVS